jgi:hypothetical protein
LFINVLKEAKRNGLTSDDLMEIYGKHFENGAQMYYQLRNDPDFAAQSRVSFRKMREYTKKT